MKIDIQRTQRTSQTGAVFSVIIPTWNNLPFLKLCIESIRKNSRFPHQLIVHVNEGNDGTLDWVKEQPDIDYTVSRKNIGICYALNYCRQLMTTDYLVYLNDDMYVCPGWDEPLYEEIKSIGHPFFFISGTAIEAYPQSKCSIQGNYGKGPDDFREDQLLADYTALPMEDWQGATWPPNVVHKDTWDLAGGYSVEFSPGMYSDPDFSMKLWQLGVRYYKGVSRSRVYHFGSVSTKRISKNRGYYQFIAKWGITSSTFTKHYLRRGETFAGILQEPVLSLWLQCKNLYKRINCAFRRNHYS